VVGLKNHKKSMAGKWMQTNLGTKPSSDSERKTLSAFTARFFPLKISIKVSAEVSQGSGYSLRRFDRRWCHRWWGSTPGMSAFLCGCLGLRLRLRLRLRRDADFEVRKSCSELGMERTNQLHHLCIRKH